MFEGDFQDLRELRKMREEAQQIDLIDQPSDDSIIEESDEFDEDSISNSRKDALSAENQQEIQPESLQNEQFMMNGQIEKDTVQNPEHENFQDRGLDHKTDTEAQETLREEALNLERTQPTNPEPITQNGDQASEDQKENPSEPSQNFPPLKNVGGPPKIPTGPPVNRPGPPNRGGKMPNILPNKPGRPGPQGPSKSGPHHPVPRAAPNVPRSPVVEKLEDYLVETQNQDAQGDRTRPTELLAPKSPVIYDEDNIQSGTIDGRNGPKLMSKT